MEPGWFKLKSFLRNEPSVELKDDLSVELKDELQDKLRISSQLSYELASCVSRSKPTARLTE